MINIKWVFLFASFFFFLFVFLDKNKYFIKNIKNSLYYDI